MSIQRVNWENGLKLDCEILIKSNLAISKRSDLSNILPFNLQKGFINFTVDHEGLQTGLILIKSLDLYIDNKRFVSFDNSYPLSIQVINDEIAATISIYLNITEKSIEKEQTKYIADDLYLSTKYDYSAKHSIKIADFRTNGSKLEALECDFPLLTMNHYLMDDIFTRINRTISNIIGFNRFIFSTSRPYASTYLNFLLLKLKRDVIFAEKNKSSVTPQYIFNILHDIYSLIISNTLDDQQDILDSIIDYEVNYAYSKFNLLLDKIEDICKNRTINNFVQFHLQGQKYICSNFPEEFFVANKHYLVVKRKTEIGNNKRFENKNKLRITSISRYTNIVTLSLSGLKLEEIGDSLHNNLAISLGDYDTVFEIKKNAEWDFILVDKSAVFSALEGSQNYDFFIAFT
ncbi:intracellular growth locus [Candidatus Francisella endociliophora]|uniref:Intracellular growth locus n=1 Tax=Candidatus Francisella endociliophora TaxID=653937 RepID=A0A097EPY2_9GAMM|nr:type VI secretion system baseplate subunit TssK [Francisella sp. FSC1006]AIT09601.1 intracellular growth locus [Francisella sp. FSC1006]